MRSIQPRVSIVIPVYNGANYLSQAIDSALAQTYKNLEVIVVNDGSTDDGATETIAKSYGSKIIYFKKKNGGVASALNLGIKEMTGEYFSWLSHDDLYVKTKIEEQVKYLNKLKKADTIVASQVMTLFESGIKKKEKIDGNTFRFIDIFLSTSAQVGVNGCTLLIPKKAFDVSGLFDVNLPVTQDYDLWFRMKDRHSFVLLDKHLVISRRHPEQDSVQKYKFLVKAGDRLHYKFLHTISYNRFEEYFKDNKKNIRHTYENYNTYKSRGYYKTASVILINILRYYSETDKDSFYRVFSTEVYLAKFERIATRRDRLTAHDRMVIEREFNLILNTNNTSLKLKEPTAAPKSRLQRSKIGTFVSRINQSVKEDGVFLTFEKIVRKVYKIIKSN